MLCKCLTTPQLSKAAAPRRTRRHVTRRSTENDNSASTATSSDAEPAKRKGGPIFYAGGAYSEQEWRNAGGSGRFEVPVWETQPEPVADTWTERFIDAMSFYGPVPELVNGRLAMLGFVTGVFAEIQSGHGILQQWEVATPFINALELLISVMTLLPYVRGPFKPSSFGPFTPEAEMLNGRFAMIGISALMVFEWVGGIVYQSL